MKVREAKGSADTHFCKQKHDYCTFCNGMTRYGKYWVRIHTSKKKLKAKRQTVKVWLKEHMHAPIAMTFQSLNRKLHGLVNYDGINGNAKHAANFFL